MSRIEPIARLKSSQQKPAIWYTMKASRQKSFTLFTNSYATTMSYYEYCLFLLCTVDVCKCTVDVCKCTVDVCKCTVDVCKCTVDVCKCTVDVCKCTAL